MCFTDMTAEARVREALENARAELESRVDERTMQLQAANAALGQATADKTRFLAAASHDLLQPLHAARLFAGALAGSVAVVDRALLDNVNRSIAAADRLLRALLDISMLDAGGIVPVASTFSTRALLAELVESFTPLATQKGLRLRLGRTDAWVETDRNLLRSIVQNFLSNAIRYTNIGGVVIGVRRRGDTVRIEVRDSGLGISTTDQARIFREFERLGHGSEVGLGLGLAIAQRTATLLEVPIDLWSVPERGSRFSITLPVAAPMPVAPVVGSSERVPSLVPATLAGLRVLVVDDDAAIREGSAALLATWGCQTVLADASASAMDSIADVDAALVDLDLGEDCNGIDLIKVFRRRKPAIACALVTADYSAETLAKCTAAGIMLFPKPIDTALLATWLTASVAAKRL